MINVEEMKFKGNFLNIINEGRAVDLWHFQSLNGGSFVTGVHKSVDINQERSYDVTVSLHTIRKTLKSGKDTLFNGVTLLKCKESEVENTEGVGVNE